MRADVQQDGTELVRELALLPSRGVIFSSEKPGFLYFETDHPGLQLQVDWLEEMGLVVDVTTRNVRIYRMTTALASWLRHRD